MINYMIYCKIEKKRLNSRISIHKGCQMRRRNFWKIWRLKIKRLNDWDKNYIIKIKNYKRFKMN